LTIVPAGIALGFVVSWIVKPAVMLAVTTPAGNVKTFGFLELVVVAAFVGVPKSVTTARDPVLNGGSRGQVELFAIVVVNDSVLVLSRC
jgi:hypothetical protein